MGIQCKYLQGHIHWVAQNIVGIKVTWLQEIILKPLFYFVYKQDMKSASSSNGCDYLFSQAIERSPQADYDTAKIPKNKARNRFGNIFPCESILTNNSYTKGRAKKY